MSSAVETSFAIQLAGVTKRFGARAVVDHVTLDIPYGHIVGLIGPNGAGKTTTIKMLMGMLRMTMGSVRVLGIDAFADPVELKQRVGYVPEVHTIYRMMPVRAVLNLCAALYERWNPKLCDELLRLFDVDPGKKVKHLSKGTLAKLSLLIALAHEPDVLILDEPMAGLDPLVREEFLDGVLRGVCDRPRTVLFSSHMLSDVQRMADTVAIIDEGKLIAWCPTDELVSRTKRLQVVLRDGAKAGKGPDGTVWQRVQGREWQLTVRGFAPATLDYLRQTYPVEHIEVTDLGLEDVFKDVIRGRRAQS